MCVAMDKAEARGEARGLIRGRDEGKILALEKYRQKSDGICSNKDKNRRNAMEQASCLESLL